MIKINTEEEIEKRINELLIMSRTETCETEVRWCKKEIQELEQKLKECLKSSK